MSTVRQRLRRVVTLLWPATVVGFVVGAAVGLLVSSFAARSSSASALVRISPPVSVDQIMTAAQPQSDASQAYLADQLAYLSSEGFLREVSQSVGGADPAAVTATQEGVSTVVQISATAADGAVATKSVDTAIDTYRRHANDSYQQQVQAAIAAIDRASAGVRADSLAVVGGVESQVDYGTLNLRLEPLKVQTVSLQVAAQRGVDVQVLSPTWSTEVTASPTLGIVGGGVLGGAIALAGALWFRTRSGVVVSVGKLEHEVGPVLRPVVKKPTNHQAGRLSGREAAVARTLGSQLPPPHDGRTLVVGATASSGAPTVARLLGYASSEHGSVATAQASEYAGMDRGQLRDALDSIEESQAKDGATIVVGSSFATQPALTALLPLVDKVVCVVRVGNDTADQVESMRRAVSGFEGPTVTVATTSSVFGSDSGGGSDKSADADAQVTPPSSEAGESSPS